MTLNEKLFTLPPLRQALPIFVVLVAAGLCGNYFNYELFFSIQFIFGSIFAMLVLQILGLGPGTLAALLISSVTYLLWNHPYAMVIMTGEAFFVGILVGRRDVRIVVADALYWLCIGMPLVYLFYHGVMGLTISNATITMVKQAVNGIANTLAARLIFMALYSRLHNERFSLREFDHTRTGTLGLQLVEALAGQLGDTLEFFSGEGTGVVITFSRKEQ